MLYLCRKQPPRAEKSRLAASLFEGLMMVISSIGGLYVKRWIEGEGHRRSHFYRQCFAWQLDIGRNWAD